jgi:hypothetical protein
MCLNAQSALILARIALKIINFALIASHNLDYHLLKKMKENAIKLAQ